MTQNPMKNHRFWQGWLQCQRGAASIEFITVMPLAVAVFFASAESGILSLRQTFLDRALELTIREVRLGMITNTSSANLKSLICARMAMVDNCAENLALEMNVRSSFNFLSIPNTTTSCIDRATNTEPVLTYEPGAENELVLVRACLVQDIVFPTSVAQVSVFGTTNQEFHLISTTVFVKEPG